KVLVIGGLDANGNATANVELYDPASNAWSAAASMTTARAYQTATLLANGRVLVAGGRADSNHSSLCILGVDAAPAHQWPPAPLTFSTRPATPGLLPVPWHGRGPTTRRRCSRTARCWSLEGSMSNLPSVRFPLRSCTIRPVIRGLTQARWRRRGCSKRRRS